MKYKAMMYIFVLLDVCWTFLFGLCRWLLFLPICWDRYHDHSAWDVVALPQTLSHLLQTHLVLTLPSFWSSDLYAVVMCALFVSCPIQESACWQTSCSSLAKMWGNRLVWFAALFLSLETPVHRADIKPSLLCFVGWQHGTNAPQTLLCIPLLCLGQCLCWCCGHHLSAVLSMVHLVFVTLAFSDCDCCVVIFIKYQHFCGHEYHVIVFNGKFGCADQWIVVWVGYDVTHSYPSSYSIV